MTPPGALLPVGHVFNAPIGFRRWLTPGEHCYIHRENRRYWCVIRAVIRQPHTTRHGRPVTRSVLTVQIKEHA